MPVLLGMIVVSLTVSACMTQSALEIGSAHENPTGYREVLLSGTTLQLHYNTKAYFSGLGGSTAIENPPDRWTIVSLDSLYWLGPDRLGSTLPSEVVPRVCSATRSTPEPAPAMTLHKYEGTFKFWYSPDAPDYEAPVAAYVDQKDSTVLVLVRVSASDRKRVVTSLHAFRRCDYDLPWAPYARAALVPFAVLADIITSPFQALYLLSRFPLSH
jgi:hypothetical protein